MKNNIFAILVFLGIVLLTTSQDLYGPTGYPIGPTGVPNFYDDPLRPGLNYVPYNTMAFPFNRFPFTGSIYNRFPFNGPLSNNYPFANPVNGRLPFTGFPNTFPFTGYRSAEFPVGFPFNNLPLTGSSYCCSSDLIANGNFESNHCASANGSCISGRNSYVLTAWTPNPTLEFGESSNYNNLIPSSSVLELDPLYNSCVDQVFSSCGAGQYMLRFDHAATQQEEITSSDFIVRINGRTIRTFTHYNYFLQSQQIPVSLNTGMNIISLCGTGESDSFGALIDNVSIRCL